MFEGRFSKLLASRQLAMQMRFVWLYVIGFTLGVSRIDHLPHSRRFKNSFIPLYVMNYNRNNMDMRIFNILKLLLSF
jgi:hypothetical protein